MAFECPHCGFRNNELQSAGVFNERGHTISLSVHNKEVNISHERIQQQLITNIHIGYEPSISQVRLLFCQVFRTRS